MGRANRSRKENRQGPRTVIIGAGISGILMGIRLRERGWNDFVILEKAESLGGTWRDNRYPGAACDVPAHLYVYSFAPNPAWRTRFARAPDIWRYYHRVARRYGVLPHIRYGKEVARAAFGNGRWCVTTADGIEYDADIVISCVGRLHHPSMPDIPGADSFAGPTFHTSRWDHSLDLRGKRLGVIGTGSSATQVVSVLAEVVGRLKLFQRTAQWILPAPDTPIPVWRRLLYRLWPAAARRRYRELEEEVEFFAVRANRDPAARAKRDAVCRKALGKVRDPELRAKLTPTYAVGCKRLVLSGEFYDAVQSPTVDLVVEAIERIEPRGIVTSDGILHEIDALVFATGFKAHAFLRPMQLVGENGITLDDVWNEFPLTYRSVAIPHMPNFFILNGPYSPGGSASIVGIAETQAAYVMQLLDRIVRQQVLLTPDEAASRDWLMKVREQARDTIWATGGCKSWYLDHTGTPAYDPSSLSELREALAKVDFSDFIERAANGDVREVAEAGIHGR